jgi:beta-lactamase regulating signal transducer with metallopeptidase domain/protocatechuate 3,4-dioxygenase beta subunit
MLQASSDQWGDAMWRASWQGAIAILLVWGICRVFPKLPQPAQSWLWRLAFVKLLLGLVSFTPMVFRLLPLSLVGATVEPSMPMLSLPIHAVVASPALAGPSALAAGHSTLALSAQVTPTAICFLLWLIGVGWGCYLVVRAYRRVSVLLQQCTSILAGEHIELLTRLVREYGLKRVPRLMSHPSIGSPLLVGVLTPTLLIPAAFAIISDPQALRLVYAHELAHLRRNDLLWGWLLTVGRVLFFFHPCVWFAKGEWQFWHEIACDASALETTHATHGEFGRVLLGVVTQSALPHHDFAAVGIGESFRMMKRRLLALEKLTPMLRTRLVYTGALVLLIGCAMLLPIKFGASTAIAQGPLGTSHQLVDQTKVGIVNGRVLTPDGQPVANATVAWVGWFAHGSEYYQQFSAVQSDAAGKFSFADTRQLWEDCGWLRGTILLEVEAPGCGITWTNVPENSVPVEIKLSPATSVRLIFVDEKNAPVAGLHVTLVDLMNFNQTHESGCQTLRTIPVFQSRHSQVTDLQGVCQFTDLPQGANIGLRINDTRYGPLELKENYKVGSNSGTVGGIILANSTETPSRRIVLNPAATISGQVISAATGKGVEGITVVAIDGIKTEYEYAEAVTDSIGQYHLTGLRGGQYSVMVNLTNAQAAEMTAIADTHVQVDAGKQRDGIDFSLIRGSLITGKITDTDTGKPIAYVRVSVQSAAYPVSSDFSARQDVVTGAQGIYRIRVPAGPVHWYMWMDPPAPGYQWTGGANENFTIGDGMVKTINCTLQHE